MRKQNALTTRTPAAAARNCFTRCGGRVVGADVGTRLGPRYCRRSRRRPRTAVRTRCTHARRVRYVRPPRTMGKHLRPLPCDKAAAAAVPPRRGCTTARVQHPAVEISETGLGDAPPERDPYTIKIARVGTTYEYDNTTTTMVTMVYWYTTDRRPARVLARRSVRYYIMIVLPDETRKNRQASAIYSSDERLQSYNNNIYWPGKLYNQVFNDYINTTWLNGPSHH